ncbi:nucleotidyltransferase family protein [Tunturibacter psychrotolerans]|uniref:Nucleotidyltransferase family protein n=1 Tax=Tunturiibacter psychrotolerans TaxID=3069686 RepID=A0AAU7ZKM6_9BACT
MNYQLAEAVIATFRQEDPSTHHEALSKFNYRAWQGTYRWLDASGLALYLLNRLEVLGIQAAIPGPVLLRLQENAEDNQANTMHLFQEFMVINREFTRVGLCYANLKGFTLVPDAFREVGQRLQLDLDFLVDRSHIFQCQRTLERQGYLLTGEGPNVKEFKAGNGRLPSLKDLYKPKLQRCVEIHFDDVNGSAGRAFRHDRLARAGLRRWEDLELPILSDCDRFIALADHLFKHLKGEWTRASWILEYVNFVNVNEENYALWAEVRRCASESEETKLAIGVATRVSLQMFDIRRMPDALAWTIRELPPTVSLWLDRYGKKVVFARFPGTKLYLLLHWAMARDGIVGSREAKSPFPLHRPARITVKNPSSSLLVNLGKVLEEFRFFLFRLYFHLEQGCYYMLEAAHWKRSVAFLRKADPHQGELQIRSLDTLESKE